MSFIVSQIQAVQLIQKYPQISETRTNIHTPRKPHNIWGANRPGGLTRPLCPGEEEEETDRQTDIACAKVVVVFLSWESSCHIDPSGNYADKAYCSFVAKQSCNMQSDREM